MFRNVRVPGAGLTADSCPAGGEHQFQLWSAKYRCIKCGCTR